MHALRPDFSAGLIELAHQPEEQSIRLSNCGVRKILIDRVQTKPAGEGQVTKCYSAPHTAGGG